MSVKKQAEEAFSRPVTAFHTVISEVNVDLAFVKIREISSLSKLNCYPSGYYLELNSKLLRYTGQG